MCGSGGVDIASMGARLGPPGSPPLGEGRQRTAANARERDRTNSVNTAFTALRTLIPTEPADRYTCRLVSCVTVHFVFSKGFKENMFHPRFTNNRVQHLSFYDCRKLSKIETLRLASSYISHLGNVLLLGEGLHDGQPCHAPSPPFFHVSSSPSRGSDPSAQPKHICTFCLSNQRKMVS